MKEKRSIKLKLTQREFDTVLAALRLRQLALDGVWPMNKQGVPELIEAIARNHGMPLTSRDIDHLCERINT